jgi:hypothetical protein
MAEHGTVEYAVATDKDVAADLVAHEATYEGFVHLAFVGTCLVINIILGLAIGATTGHWGVAFGVLILAHLIAIHGLAAGARTPIMVMTAFSLLMLAVTAA